jgi:formylglycine-generating enzyme required for sulfatase activity
MAALAASVLTGCGGRDARTPPPVISEDGFDMVFVGGGTFLMGCTDEQGNCYDCHDVENPAREVTLSDFYISKYETTQGLWKAVMGDNPSYFTGDDNLPVEDVSWDEIREFIRRLNRISGREYRLPVETEWEFAARGGNKSNGYKYSGSDSIGDVGWYEDNNDKKTHPVGTKAPNELEIYDMSGNVWEWVDDGSGWGSSKLVRGGSIVNPAARCRVSCRGVSNYIHNGESSLGFRLALSNHNKASSKSLKKSLLPKKDTTGQGAVPASTPYVSFNPDSMDMVFVEGGKFMMGCTAEQGDNCDADEKPARSVTVSSFLIGRYEVTKGLWKVVMENKPFEFTEDDYLPEVNVGVNHVENFLRELRMKTGKRWYLPSDAEWEYAARGGKYSKGYRYSGSDNIDDVAWYGYDSCVTMGQDSVRCYGDGNSGGKAHPVGTKAPNELGIHDMTGNVEEWVDSHWRWDSDEMSHYDRPYRVYRGGSWFSGANDSRVSNRDKLDLYCSGTILGFRIARAAEFTASAPPPARTLEARIQVSASPVTNKVK